MEKLNIYQKLLEAQKQLPCLVKEKAKNDGLKYAFVSHDEVTSEVKKVFAGLGLLCLATVDSSVFSEVEVEKWDYKANGLKKAVNTYCTLNITVKIINVDNATEVVETKAVGQGIDEGDKATGKAYSYAFKYALLKLLMAETAEDSDNDQQTTKQNKPLPVPAAEKKRKYQSYLDNLAKVANKEMLDTIKTYQNGWVAWTRENYSQEYVVQLNNKFLELEKKFNCNPVIDDELPAGF